MTKDPVRVLVYYRQPADVPRAVETSYEEARAAMLGTTAGLTGLQLLRSMSERGAFILLMEWDNLRSFQTWERELRRQGHPSPMRSYQDRSRPGGHYEIFALTGG